MSVPQLLAQTFGTAKMAVGDTQALSDALQDWYQTWPEHHFLHPCIISDRPALVCQSRLSQFEPAAFNELQTITDRYGIYLKQDARQTGGEHKGANRRRNSGVVLMFCLSLLAASRTVSAHDLHSAAANPYEMPISGLQVYPVIAEDGSKIVRLQRARPPSAAQILAAYQAKAGAQDVSPADRSSIGAFLKQAYQARADDPINIAADLQKMADYYACYPQAVALIQSLAEHKVALKYRQGTWQAQAWGSQQRVDSVTIHFDTRTGAQLLDAPGCEDNPACSISAADALLHELLHAQLMLLESERFIALGGMQGHIYPYDHEQDVLVMENRLYRAMNREDGRLRPLRQRHTGSLLQVACAVCNPGMQPASSEAE
jgi:hypothetical protein